MRLTLYGSNVVMMLRIAVVKCWIIIKGKISLVHAMVIGMELVVSEKLIQEMQ